MTIERNSDEIIIRLPANVDTAGLQSLIDYLMFKEATASSKASQADVDTMVADTKKGWWQANKNRVAK
ncbi:MAG: hypothetical protein C0424_03180 [Sphingobacteriaceae bacterium]|nr:hypothetical protein [Sphingobacteriaceae bacterium]